MRNTIVIFIAAGLIVGAGFAQDRSESVEGVLVELDGYQAPAAIVEEAEVIEAPAAAEEVAVGVESVVQDLDVGSTMEESRELYVGGEFEKAQKGFAEVVQVEPENILARMYLRKIMERDQRIVEIEGMKEVDAAWATGSTLRSYAISSAAREDMGLDSVGSSVDVSEKFPEVSFPEGATAVYQPNVEKIFVRNTRENLVVLEEILAAMDAANLSTDVDQIEIEAKFVEVSEGTLEELGFQWDFQDPQVHTGIEGDDVVFRDGNGLFANALRASPNNTVGGADLPFGRRDDIMDQGTSAAGDTAWSAFRFDNTFNSAPDTLRLESAGSTPLDIVISALDQSSGTDVLSAPRVVTRNGREAVIRVGELHNYPEIYETGSTQATPIHINYREFEEKLLGVELNVTPTLNGDQIELELNPRITELAGWQNYLVAPVGTVYNHRQDTANPSYSLTNDIVARLPIFKVRTIDTEVTIADGGTIGMGGLISETVDAFEDKVPVLGSLPLVGRLFRNEGERAVKRNLLMFVTARKVQATGRIRTDRSFE